MSDERFIDHAKRIKPYAGDLSAFRQSHVYIGLMEYLRAVVGLAAPPDFEENQVTANKRLGQIDLVTTLEADINMSEMLLREEDENAGTD